MFERFTDRARRVVVLAQQEARLLDHAWIGTEHLLLGLLRDGDGIPARVLTEFGITLDGARQAVENVVGRGQEAPTGHIPFTPRSKKVLELSLREALQLGTDPIGSEHILLALLREGDGVAAQVLVASGADLNRVRRQVIGLLPAAEEAGILAAAAPAAGDDLTGRLMSIAVRLDAIERQLGADPGQLRTRVLEQIAKHPEELDPSPLLPSAPRPRRDPLPHQVQALLGRIEERLSAIERHLGIDAGEGGLTGPGNVVPPS